MNLGGVQTLFARLAEALVGKVCSVKIVDYPDGIYHKIITNTCIELVTYTDNVPLKISGASVVIMPAEYIVKSKMFITTDSTCKIVYWFVHPYNVVVNFPFFNYFSKLKKHSISNLIWLLYRKDMKSLSNHLMRLNEDSCLFFMDLECYEVNKKIFGLNCFIPKFLPIPVEKPKHSLDVNVNNSFCWLGRIEDFKTNILDRVLHDFINSNLSNDFIVIGEGRDLNKLRARYVLRKNIRFVGIIKESSLESYLCSNVSLMFAMGTSAIESAKLGIPTILLDAFYGDVPDNYRYRWIFRSQGYTLGRIIDRSYNPESGDLDFGSVISEITDNFDLLSQQSRIHFERNHSLEIVLDGFNEMIKYHKEDNITFRVDFNLGFSFLFRAVLVIKKIIKSRLA